MTVSVNLLDRTVSSIATHWGFDQLKPRGLAEVVVLGVGGFSAPADAARNRARALTVDCDHIDRRRRGPVRAHLDRTTVGALLDGEPPRSV